MYLHAYRLLNVARALRESPVPKRFSMTAYLSTTRVNGCAAPSCAFGHYACRPDMQDFMRVASNWIVSTKYPSYPVGYSSDEALDHFNLSVRESMELFAQRGCADAVSPEAAATYIEHFVARKWPSPTGAWV